jgi:hypothetical protein
MQVLVRQLLTTIPVVIVLLSRQKPPCCSTAQLPVCELKRARGEVINAMNFSRACVRNEDTSRSNHT